MIRSRLQGMYLCNLCAHKNATLTSIQHTVLGSYEICSGNNSMSIVQEVVCTYFSLNSNLECCYEFYMLLISKELFVVSCSKGYVTNVSQFLRTGTRQIVNKLFSVVSPSFWCSVFLLMFLIHLFVCQFLA